MRFKEFPSSFSTFYFIMWVTTLGCERKKPIVCHLGLYCVICTLSAELTVDVVTLSVSGLDKVELSEKTEPASYALSHTNTVTVCRISTQSLNTVAGLPGLLSFSSLSSRPPETPLSLDWSCTFILSLLLILHTELLEDNTWKQMLALRALCWCHGTFYLIICYLPTVCLVRS